jgi:hypothetical protein
MLEKWYCDVVDNGIAHIHYLASLRLGTVVIGYRGLITSQGQRQSSLFAGSVQTPTWQDGQLSWPLPKGPLLFSDVSQPIAPVNLWDRGAKRLFWHPVVPNGDVSGTGLSSQARGYAEVLRMNFGPWHLGLKTLLWGRFCGQRHSLIWIVWEGSHAKKLALLDGQHVDLHSIDEHHVSTHGAYLDLRAPKTLVSERLDHGSLKGLPLRGPMARLSFLRGLEEKWYTNASLSTAIGIDHGHAIFERVTWD